MIVKIECPECKTDGNMSLADVSYTGPYKCWKCKALFTIDIKDDKLISCEPLSQEEFDKQQEELKAQQEEFKRQQEMEEFKNRFKQS